MPSAIELANQYGDDLHVILVESQGSSQDEAERFAWGKGWMGSPALWTTERPVVSGANGLPNYVLLGADGAVLSKGSSTRDKSKVEDLIADAVSNLGDPPDDAPKSLKKAYSSFADGDFDKAIATCEKAIEKGDDVDAAEALIDEFVGRLESRIAFMGRMIDDGFAIEAQTHFEAFEKGAEDVVAIAESFAALSERFESDAFEAELDAQTALEKALKKAYADGIDSKTAKKLRDIAEDHAGTVTAERASHLASMQTE